MPPTERQKSDADLVDLICELIELPRARIAASFLGLRGADTDRLIKIGVMRPGKMPATITCRACDEDHAATPEFDARAGRYSHFCPVVGRVPIEPRDLATFEVRVGALVDLLVAAFPVLPAIGRALVTERIWQLGEAVVSGTSLTLIFARRIGSQQALGALARAIAAVPVTEIGMIVTTSPLPDSQLLLPKSYTVVSLRDIASCQKSRLEINRPRVAAYIKMFRGTQPRLRDGRGRPSDQNLVADAYQRRRQRGEPFITIAAEARAIRKELAQSNRDRVPPGVSTIRGHVGKLRSPRS